jgi:NADH dehydrogenase FAD-containing subunit
MNQVIDSAGARSRIVIVGAGYAGYHCARHLERSLPRGAAEIVIVSPADYMPNTSLLPEVGAGAGTTGTEVAAQGQLFTRAALRRYPRIRPGELRWLLVDRAPAILPELGPRLAGPALRILRRRGVDVRLNTSIEQATGSQVRLSDGTSVPTRTLVWTVGVTPGPLTQALGLDTVKGRIVVDEFLTVPGHPDVFAAGDAAAAPDLTRPGQLTAMTAQHAQRQGKAAARNIAATLGHRTRKPCKHRDLGTVVGLGGWQAVANPLHVPISGPLANSSPARLPPVCPARQPAASRHRLDQRHHRTPPVRPARPDPQRILRSHSSRAHRHPLPNDGQPLNGQRQESTT